MESDLSNGKNGAGADFLENQLKVPDTMPTETPNNIRTLRQARKMTLGQLAAKAGLSESNLSRLERGERHLSFDHIVKLSVALECHLSDISPDWVDTALPEGAVHVPLQGDDLPVMGKVAAGQWLEIAMQSDEPLMTIPVPVDRKLGSTLTYGLLVEGTSINRIANEGDVLVCLDINSGLEPRDGDVVIVERRKAQMGIKEVTAKRFRRTARGVELWPDSDDPRWQDKIDVDDGGPDTEVAIIATVLWVYRSIPPMR